jgi:Raf kinase inhibitor-like YbhB/YbcL family protein
MESRSLKVILIVPLLAASLFFVSSTVEGKEKKMDAKFGISSPVFENNGGIPAKYTCDGEDINPALLIQGVPANSKSLALIVDDPDAPRGMWVHWVVWNIDPKTTEIRENSVPKDAVQGINDFRRQNFGGPCPPSGTHRYYFKLYALDTVLNLGTSSEKTDLEKAMKGHIISQAQIMGTYKRK